MLRDDLIYQLDSLLQPQNFEDYCPNGLQLEGKPEIEHIITAVSASQQLIDQAAILKADAVLVHHGLFWRGESMAITGIKYRRLKTLIANDINLIAYHLPLDAHPELGNNAELARLLGFKVKGTFADIGSVAYGFYGELNTPQTAAELGQTIFRVLRREPLHIKGSNADFIKTVAWCSGGAQNLIDHAAKLKVDAYLSGEISEHTVHKARELRLDYFAVGHHASERYGVEAVGKYIQSKFDIKHSYIELDNPV